MVLCGKVRGQGDDLSLGGGRDRKGQGRFPLCCETVQDLQDREAKYGPTPDEAFVALHTGRAERRPDMNALSNFDEEGGENFPGWSMEALQ